MFVEALGLRDTTLMVHDWGRPIGFGVAARNPDRFAAVVVANSFAWPVNGDLRFELFSRIMGGPIGKLLTLHANAFVNFLVPAGTRRTRRRARSDGGLPRAVRREIGSPGGPRHGL